MDFKEELLREHSRKQAQAIAAAVDGSPVGLLKLVEVYLQGPYRVTQRAAWPLSIVAERKPQMLKPHLSKLISFLRKPGIHDAVKRNTMRLLQFVDIPKKEHGRVADICFTYLTNKKEAVAVKVFAMTVMAKIADDEPELKRELKLIIEDQLPYASAAFHARARKILNSLK